MQTLEAIVEDMSPGVNISFSFCLFPADVVLEASVRIGVDMLFEIIIDKNTSYAYN